MGIRLPRGILGPTGGDPITTCDQFAAIRSCRLRRADDIFLQPHQRQTFFAVHRGIKWRSLPVDTRIRAEFARQRPKGRGKSGSSSTRPAARICDKRG